MSQYISFPVLGAGAAGDVVAADVATQAAIALYVETTGSDLTGDGTILKPFLTIQKAVDSLPKQINHTVTINVGIGTFAGCNFEGFSINTLGVDVLGVTFVGTMSTSVLAGGLSSGIVASATAGTGDSVTWGTATVTGAGWTDDDLRGRFIRIDAGTGAGQILPIVSNTATVITVAGNWTAPTGATFTIVEPDTIINAAFNNVQVGGTHFYIHGCQGGTELGFNPDRMAVHLKNFKFTGARGIRITAAVRAKFENLLFATSTAGLVVAANGGRVEVHKSVFNGGTSGLEAHDATLVLTQRNLFLACGTGFNVTSSGLTAIGMASNTVSNMNFYRACTSQAIFVNGVMAISGDIINAVTPGSRIGILSTGVAGFTRISASNISNCGVAIQAAGAGLGRFISLLGVVASPTTVFGDAGGAGNTTAFLLSKGVPVQIASTATITGTTELSMDGTSTTLAAMRAASPKVITNAEFGTRVYE